MTKFNNYVPQAPKTYEVRYVEVKEPSKLSTIAGYLGVKTVYNCNEKDCKCLIKNQEQLKEIVKIASDSANEAAGKYGGTTDTKVTKDSVTVTYYGPGSVRKQ
jgi:hypothetical protein